MMTSGISVQAADFSDDTSIVEEQSVGSAEEEAPEVEDGSEFQDVYKRQRYTGTSGYQYPLCTVEQYIQCTGQAGDGHCRIYCWNHSNLTADAVLSLIHI